MMTRFTMAIIDQLLQVLARAWSITSIALLAFLLSAAAHAQTTVEYIHTDALGSPVAVTNASGNVIEREVYEPYGSPITRPPSDQPGFTGHVADSLTGLTYMQQRYYDPQVGRFLSVDPVTAYSNPVGAFNRYWYANNNPYRFTDPDGRCVWDGCVVEAIVVGAAIGAVINTGVQMYRAEGSLSERWSAVNGKQVAVAAAAGGAGGVVGSVASSAVTTGGMIAANTVGGAAVGAVSAHASAAVEGKAASTGDVVKGAALGGALSGTGAAIGAAPGALARSASAGMTQTQRTATGNLLGGIESTTRSAGTGFQYANPLQSTADAAAATIGALDNLTAQPRPRKDQDGR
ncbi:RHS repeat-associated core domain-containing protein [Stenotrophomonas sp. MH1]|uniref:RHS repeat-associated core domain-containing protein n=1 Tax=Stenotrophomonas capsici TaxID=3110230 RepID=A0ABU5V3W9_9GAMM|nr:RHS repeat-associated core domain-containing protein [Stenotrophomonas sp. MH1]MEA5668065.1 RHS repeat-associated core domain-containing protein [Stenotrophomonas sp. MH1]